MAPPFSFPMLLTTIHRSVRRLILLTSLAVVILLVTAYTRPSSTYIPYKISLRPQNKGYTVTRTYTTWLRATQTAHPDSGISPDRDDAQSPNRVTSRKKKALEKHTYRADGLLEVNPNGPHPIFKLIRDAEVAWKNKHRRASKTLREAVVEYKRRYKRDPPRGFDHW